jgi:hypothetical protein
VSISAAWQRTPGQSHLASSRTRRRCSGRLVNSSTEADETQSAQRRLLYGYIGLRHSVWPGSGALIRLCVSSSSADRFTSRPPHLRRMMHSYLSALAFPRSAAKCDCPGHAGVLGGICDRATWWHYETQYQATRRRDGGAPVGVLTRDVPVLRRVWCGPVGGNMTAMQDDTIAEAQFTNTREDIR